MAVITYPTKSPGDQYTAAEANEVKTVVNTNAPVATIVDVEYGGVIDQASIIQAAIDAANPNDLLLFKQGEILVETQINVNKKINIQGSGGTVFKTTSDIAIFFITVTQCAFSFFEFLGNASAGGLGSNTNQVGFKASTSAGEDCLAASITANNMNGSLCHLQSIGASSRRGWRFERCTSYNCNAGIYLASGAEYTNIINCTGMNCQRALNIQGGNNQVIGGNYSENVRGIQLWGTANSGHGQIVGVTAKHNSTANLEVISFTAGLGMVISGCSFWAGALILKDCDGMNLTGNAISGTVTVDNCTVLMASNYMHTTASPTFLNSGAIIQNANSNITSGLVDWV